jgi:hypothetical protein
MSSTMRFRRLLPATILAATAVVGGSSLADPAVACAQPNTGGGYDDARYEECRKSGLNERFCCSQAGGTWTKVTVYDQNGLPASYYYMCTGSARKPVQAGGTLEPATQPPVTRVPRGVIHTFTPAPVSAAV